MVFYRKYRPQTISQLDSQEVRDKLTTALGGKSVPHAFLFTGPKGLGKTSAARIVAKVVNCERSAKRKTQNSKLIEPCNKCEQCRSITNGANLDVLEIDGASNRGIDDVRDLREKIRLSPATALKKLYIIDEVHMLTTEAFNALLKTLEEPPSHALFILCTTESQKVPQTIASRCFRITFSLATKDELVRSLTRIAKGEKLAVDKEVLPLIAELSDGSFREAAKILEELVGSAGRKKITKELLEKKYHTANIQYQISQMINILENRDAKEGLKLVGKISEQGADMKYFLEQLISQFHKLLLAELGVKTPEPKMEDGKWKMEDIRDVVGLLTKAYQELKYAVLPQLPLELVIIEWSIKRGPVSSFPPASAPLVSPDGTERVRAVGSLSTAATPRSESKAPRATDSDDIWKTLIEKVKPHNHSVAGLLRGCQLKQYDKKNLIIETGYTFHKEKLEENKTRELLEEIAKEITGANVKISVVLREKRG